jgi:hypothetical protein
MGPMPVKSKQALAIALMLSIAVAAFDGAGAALADGRPPESAAPAAPQPAGAQPGPGSELLDEPLSQEDRGTSGDVPRGARAGEHAGEHAGTGRGKLISAAGLGTLYTALSVWAYLAWYHGVPELPAFTVSGDGWFGSETYAGGADKIGHFWSNYVITRASTRLLRSGGWSRLQASMIAGGMAAVFFTFVEVKDGFYYQFSIGDAVGNTAGVALSFLLENVSAVDDLLDFRLEYRPSSEYVHNLLNGGDVNFAEDYSGQSYMLALHLSGAPRLTSSRWTSWARYVDVVAGFETRNYKPRPSEPDARRRQSLFVGASINLQHVLERAFGGPPRHTAHRMGHAFFEVYSPPYTTWRMATSSSSPDASASTATPHALP